MNTRLRLTLLFFFLFLAAAAQLVLPLRMAWRAETTRREGTPIKFRLQLRDPHDPLRGKFVRLNYNWNSFALPEAEREAVPGGQRLQVCAQVEVDAEGFGTITGVSLEPPANGLWFRVNARRWGGRDVTLTPTFDRYFVNEHDAARAEAVYREAVRRNPRRDSEETETGEAYALIRLWDGEAQLEDVFIDGAPLAARARTQP